MLLQVMHKEVNTDQVLGRQEGGGLEGGRS